MKFALFSFFTLFFIISEAANKDQMALIRDHLKKSEEATTKTLMGDKAIFHAALAENIFIEHEINDSDLEQEIQLKLIGAFRLVRQPKNAKKHLKKLLSLMVKESQSSSKRYLLNSGRLGSDYLNWGELDSALKYFELANESANLYGKSVYKASTLNNIGLLYERKKDWEKAIQYYNYASSTLQFNNDVDSILLTSINDNKANYYFEKKDSIKGIELLRANINFLLNRPKEYKKVMQYSFRLFHLLIQRKNWQESSNLLVIMKPFLLMGKRDWNLENKIKYHEANVKFISHFGDKSILLKEYKILDSLKSLELHIKDQQRILMNNTMVDYFLLSANREIEREKEKALQAKDNNEKKTFFIVFLIATFLSISLLIRSSAKRKLRARNAERQVKEQKLRLTELENQQLSQDLMHKSNDFSDLIMQTSLKENWSEKLIQQLEALNKSEDHVDSSQLKGIIRGLKQESGVYDKVNLQQKGITEVNSAFFDHLNKKYPKLTKSERELCGLIRLRLDGKEIAVIRNIHPSSVRKLRHRLRKKLDLPVEQDIYEFVAKI